MARLIDTSTLITLERARITPDKVNQILTAEASAIASITASELLIGVHLASTAEWRRRRELFLETVLATLPVLPFNLQEAQVHARIWVELNTMGQMIGSHDLLIAATAFAHGYSVLTENLRDFERVPGLVVERPDW